MKNNNRGQTTVMMAFMIPVFLLAIAMVIDVGILSYRRIQVQTATDLAAYAGASVLSVAMTDLSQDLTKLKNEYEDARADANDAGRDRSQAGITGRFHQQLSRSIWSSITETNESAYREAVAAAGEVMQRNIPWASSDAVSCDPYYRFQGLNDSELFDIPDHGEEMLHYNYVEGGGGPFDPEEHGSESYRVQRPTEVEGDFKYRKTRMAFVCLGEAPVGYQSLSGRLGSFFASGVNGSPDDRVKAVAAAQPYGGTMRFEDVYGNNIDPESIDRVYKPSLISLQAMKEEGPDRYYELRRIDELGDGSFDITNVRLFPAGQDRPPY